MKGVANKKKGGFGVVYQDVMRSDSLEPESKTIYAYLASFAGNSNICYPARKLMLKELKMSETRFSKYMKPLIALGVVTVDRERNGNVYGKNIYTLTHSIEVVENEGTRHSENLSAENVSAENLSTNNNSSNNNSSNINSLKKEIVSKDTICSTDVQRTVEAWNTIGISQITGIKPETLRYRMLKARIREYGIDQVLQAVENIKGSSFLKGSNSKGWEIKFDWFVKPNNFLKVLEGNYADKGSQTAGNVWEEWCDEQE